MKTKWLWLILGGILLVVFIFGVSYAWYRLFSDTNIVVANLAISFEDSDREVNIKDSYPVSDEEGGKGTPYSFSITNTGKVDASYRLVFKQQSPSVVNDGCDELSQLKREQLKYQLLLNQIPIAIGNLDELQNDILDLRQIQPGIKNYYQLRVWIDQDQMDADYTNKHFHYIVEVQSVEGEQ